MIDLIALFAMGYVVVIGLVALSVWVGSALLRLAQPKPAAGQPHEDVDADVDADDARVAL